MAAGLKNQQCEFVSGVLRQRDLTTTHLEEVRKSEADEEIERLEAILERQNKLISEHLQNAGIETI